MSAEGSRPGEEHRDALLCGDEGRSFLQPNGMENRELDMAPMAAAATKTSRPNWRSRAPRAGVRPWATASSLPWGKLQRAEEGAGGAME